MARYQYEIKPVFGQPDPLESDGAFLSYARRHRLLPLWRIAVGQVGLLGRRIVDPLVPKRAPATPGTAEPLKLNVVPGRQAMALVAGTNDDPTETPLVDEPKWRGSDGRDALKTLRFYNPDVSLAVDRAKTFALTPAVLKVYAVDNEGRADEHDPIATAATEAWLDQCLMSHEGGGLDALRNVAEESMATGGGIGLELVVSKDLKDVTDIALVPPYWVRYEYQADASGVMKLIPVYVGDKDTGVPFNPQQFRFIALNATVADPHGQPWLLPVLDTGPAQQELRNTLQKVLKHQGIGRLTATVDWDRIASKMPPTVTSTDQLKTFMTGVLDGIQDKFEDLKEDDNLIVYDFVEVSWTGAPALSGTSPKEMSELYDIDVAASIKTPPSLLGRAVGASLSTNADIHFRAYAMAIDARRMTVVRALEWACNQRFLIRGEQFEAVIELEPIDTEDEGEAADAESTRHATIRADMDAGLVSYKLAAEKMGYPEPEDMPEDEEPEPTDEPEAHAGHTHWRHDGGDPRGLFHRYAHGGPDEDMADLAQFDVAETMADVLLERAGQKRDEAFDWDRWAGARRNSGTAGEFRGILEAEQIGGDWRQLQMEQDRWYFHRNSQQYVRNGRVVSQQRIANVHAMRIADEERKFAKMARQYKNKEITLSQFNDKGRRLIAKQSRQAGRLAHGGRLIGAAPRTVGNGMRVQLAYWDNFMRGVANGSVPPSRLAGRAAMYGSAGPRQIFGTERYYAMSSADYDEVRRLLGSAVPCPTCADDAGRGWHWVSSMIQLGETYCDGADKCDHEYRKSKPLPFDQIPTSRMGGTGPKGWSDCGAALADEVFD